MKSDSEKFLAHNVLNEGKHIFMSGKLAPDPPVGEGHNRVVSFVGETGAK